MMCPIGFDCDRVIRSDYSSFFGIPVEIIGLAYYGLVFLGYGLSTALPGFFGPTISLFLLSLTTIAFLFSMYLVFIQGVVLREWCSWCLSSATFCAFIFLFAVWSSSFGFIEMIAYHREWFATLHLIAVALGVGSATIGDIFFLLFLKDFKISVDEANILRRFGEISWFALAGVILSDIAIYFPFMEEASASSAFTAQFFILLILILNSAFFYLVISPKLVGISFEKMGMESARVQSFRKTAFSLGALSLVSWYFILILSSAVDTGLSLGEIFVAYLAISVIAIFAGLVLNNIYLAKSKEKVY